MKVYLVRGKCGQYEDYREWIVGVFAVKEKAEQHFKRLQTTSKKANAKLAALQSGTGWWQAYQAICKAQEAIDPLWSDQNTEYYIEEWGVQP